MPEKLRRFTSSELREMPTLATGQTSDLKWQGERTRFWLSRCGVEDGEPFNSKVTVERLIHGTWEVVGFYRGARDGEE